MEPLKWCLKNFYKSDEEGSNLRDNIFLIPKFYQMRNKKDAISRIRTQLFSSIIFIIWILANCNIRWMKFLWIIKSEFDSYWREFFSKVVEISTCWPVHFVESENICNFIFVKPRSFWFRMSKRCIRDMSMRYRAQTKRRSNELTPICVYVKPINIFYFYNFLKKSNFRHEALKTKKMIINLFDAKNHSVPAWDNLVSSNLILSNEKMELKTLFRVHYYKILLF